MRCILLLSILLLSGLFCNIPVPPTDPSSPGYVPPSFTIDSTKSNIADKDTIVAKTCTLTLVGNSTPTLFRWRIDHEPWSAWKGQNVQAIVITTTFSGKGDHTVYIEVCYDPVKDIKSSELTIYQLLSPVIGSHSAPQNSLEAGKPCTLWVDAAGDYTAEYAWFKSGTNESIGRNDMLVLDSFTISDTGYYYCVIEAEGKSTQSAPFHLQLTPRFNVKYNGKERSKGTVPIDPQTYKSGEKVTVLVNSGDLSKDGFTFIGWNTAADGSGKSYQGGNTFIMENGDLTLYAQWTQNPTYNVIYKGNSNTGGSVPEDLNNYEGEDTVTVQGNTGNLIRDGYTFKGWNTSSDGTGTAYPVDEIFLMKDENCILYAQWTQNPTYTITYTGNGNTKGQAPTDNNNYETGTKVNIRGNTDVLAREGFSFVGWNTVADGSGKTYEAEDTLVIGSVNVKLYAQWNENPTYTITYNGNGNTDGTAPVDQTTYENGETAIIAGVATLVKENATFTGWNTRQDGNGHTYQPESTVVIGSENVTLYAMWTENPSYNVTYFGNGNTTGAVPTDEKRYKEGNCVNILAPGNLEREGYRFLVWNTAEDGDGSSYSAGSQISMPGNALNLYAQWEHIQFTISYNSSGHSQGMPPDDQQFNFNEVVTLDNNSGNLIRPGYTFIGWNIAADGSGTMYPPDTSFVITGNLVVYAQWQPVKYIISYNGNGNNGGLAPVAVFRDYGSTFVLPGFRSLWRRHFAFVGWNTSADGSGTAYSEGDQYTVGEGNVIFYAQWDPIGMTMVSTGGISFLMGGPQGEDDEKPYHSVSFSSNFWIDTIEVRQQKYNTVMTNNYGGYSAPDWSSEYGVGDDYPVYNINWYDAALFCNGLTKASNSTDTVYRFTSITGTPGNNCVLEGLVIDLTKKGFHLPTETQWEIASRAGTFTAYFWSSDSAEETLKQYAWFENNANDTVWTQPHASAPGAQPVAQKTPNTWNLYDMLGNVLEWCNDWYGAYSGNAGTPQNDPTGPATGDERVARGGYWMSDTHGLRCADREAVNPTTAHFSIGFRVCFTGAGR